MRWILYTASGVVGTVVVGNVIYAGLKWLDKDLDIIFPPEHDH